MGFFDGYNKVDLKWGYIRINAQVMGKVALAKIVT